MTAQHHLLEIYEPYDYQGRNPINVEGVGVVKGPNGTFYYLLDLAEPLEVDAETVSQLLLLPRYNGDSIERATTSTCTVNVCRTRGGIRMQADVTFSFEDIRHWGVGKIAPILGS
ncbi:MAG: hypothetical protein P8124_00505 [Gammaproteobacteria bacterium]